LNQELFLSLAEVRFVIDRWRMDYNHHRPHSALDYRTPAVFAIKDNKWHLFEPGTEGKRICG
jgi:transposase InsO family protein